MQISFILLFIWIVIFLISLLSSPSHILKSATCCLLTGLILFIYIYLERSFPVLTSFKAMSAYFYFSLQSKFAIRHLSEAQMNLVSEGIYSLCFFLVIYIISFVILTAFAFGGNSIRTRHHFLQRIFFGLFFIACWGFVSSFFVSAASCAVPTASSQACAAAFASGLQE